MSGTLYLVPTPLGECAPESVLPATAIACARGLDYFIAENPKTARAFLKAVGHPGPLQTVDIRSIEQSLSNEDVDALLAPLLSGRDAGVVSEAGNPGVADPGAQIVRRAHELGLRVVPLVGPSSILLALAASGLEGQRFAFHGYLPVEAAQLARRLKELEEQSRRRAETQIFIETPYRNDRLLRSIIETCRPATRLCVASDLTLATETIRTRRVHEWSDTLIGKRPSVFLILAE